MLIYKMVFKFIFIITLFLIVVAINNTNAQDGGSSLEDIAMSKLYKA